MSDDPLAGPATPPGSVIPAWQARRRARTAMTASLTVLAAVWLVPPLLLRPLADPANLAGVLAFAVWLGVQAIRCLSNARGSARWRQAGCLTALTWTGRRTIDLGNLKRIRAWRWWSGRRAGNTTYVRVTDSAGVTITFTRAEDLRMIRRALRRRPQRPDQEAPVKVSRLAAHALGLAPLPWGVSGLWGFASIYPPFFIAMTVFATVIPLAGK